MSEPISSTARLRGSADVIGAEMSGSLVLLHTKSWTYLDLNDTGMFIWNLLAQPQPIAAVTSALVEKYEVEPAMCEQETRRFLEDLRERGFIEVDG